MAIVCPVSIADGYNCDAGGGPIKTTTVLLSHHPQHDPH